MTRDDLLPSKRSPAQLIEAMGCLGDDDRRDLIQAVESLTEHSDPLVREEALRLLLSKWRAVGARWRGVRALEHDEDFGVRAQAALSLARSSIAATHDEDGRLILSHFLDDLEDDATRRSCYDALLMLHERGDFPTGHGPDWLTQVDWDWIAGLRQTAHL